MAEINCFSIYTIILLFCGCNLGICVYAAKMGDLSWIDYRNPKVILWSHIDFTSPHLFYKPCWVNFTIDSLDWSVQVNSCTVQLYTRPENLCTVHGNPAKVCAFVYQFLNIFLKLNRKKLFETFLCKNICLNLLLEKRVKLEYAKP